MLACLVEHQQKCEPVEYVAPKFLRPQCLHWSTALFETGVRKRGGNLYQCKSKIGPPDESTRCKFQEKVCHAEEFCIHHWKCRSPNHSLFDGPNLFSTMPMPKAKNDIVVFSCNQIYGFPHGISMTYRHQGWQCEMSQKTYNMSCGEIVKSCKNIAKCIETSEPEHTTEVSLSLQDCESPLEAARTKPFCSKIPIVLERERRRKYTRYLKACTFHLQIEKKYYTDPNEHDTFCCKKDTQLSTKYKYISGSINCYEQHETCNEIMKCYFNFESTILELLELFDMQNTLIIYIVVCIIGIIINHLSLYSKMFSVKTYTFIKIKLNLESTLLIMTILYVSLNHMSEGDEMPMQVKWINDSVAKWILYVLLSMQSLSTLTNCFYIAFITKFPLQTKEIKEKMMSACYVGYFVVVSFHIPRFFLEPTISSSFCSLFNSEKIAYKYSLEFQMLKNTLEYGGSALMKDEFYINYHENCYAYYRRIKLSSAFFVYNVVIDSLFLHVTPILMILVSMGIFVREIKMVIERRKELNFHGRVLKVVNVGTLTFIVQSVSMTVRHLLVVISSFYIWYNDRNNIFLTSTLGEQFSVNLLNSAVTITVSNFLAIVLLKLYQ